jgi:hypothetical protein
MAMASGCQSAAADDEEKLQALAAASHKHCMHRTGQQLVRQLHVPVRVVHVEGLAAAAAFADVVIPTCVQG